MPRNLTKRSKHLYIENKTLTEEFKEDLNKCRTSPSTEYCEDVGSSQTAYRLKANPVKIPIGHLMEPEKLILKYMWKCKLP